MSNKPIFNNDKETRKLEEEALKVNEKDTLYEMSYYYGDYNQRTGDVNIFCYENHLKKIIGNGKQTNEN